MPVRQLWLTVASMSIVASSAMCLTACSSSKTTMPRSTTPETQSATMNAPPGEQGAMGQQPGMGQHPGMGQQPGMGQPPAANVPPANQDQPPPPPAAAVITEEQIIAIVNSASSGEVEQAKLVATHSTNAKVKGFADRMLKDHTAVLREMSQVVQRQKITPMDNPVSMRLTENSRQLTDSLMPKKGKEFDKEYMGAQVREHRMVLDMLDEKLIPNSKNPEIKNSLMQLRGKVEMHLREAEDILRSLATTTGGTGPQ